MEEDLEDEESPPLFLPRPSFETNDFIFYFLFDMIWLFPTCVRSITSGFGFVVCFRYVLLCVVFKYNENSK